jgi:hypothetical protein
VNGGRRAGIQLVGHRPFEVLNIKEPTYTALVALQVWDTVYMLNFELELISKYTACTSMVDSL